MAKETAAECRSGEVPNMVRAPRATQPILPGGRVIFLSAGRGRRGFIGSRFGSGPLRVYAPQFGHGRDSIACRSYSDQFPAIVQEWPHEPQQTAHVPTS